jgi:tRNA pseudouridine38-40 synthase
VQAEVEAALAVLVAAPVRTVAAGRTDAGVHALAQVVHADLPAERGATLADDAEAFTRSLNGLLPTAIRVQRAAPAPAGFDARFSALSRRYRYRVTDETPDPLRRHDTLHWPRALDVARLEQASAKLLGEHDFAAYCRRRAYATTRRTLTRLSWSVAQESCGRVLSAEVVADAFCHSMVRSLVGALLAVGDGRAEESWPAALLGRSERVHQVVVAPPHGLTLMAVRYPPDAELAGRASVTRTRRDDPGAV